VNHFAAKYTTDERLEPVADTEDRLKIRGLGRPQPLDTAAECKRLRCGPLSSDDSRFAPGGMSGVLSRSTQPCDSSQTSDVHRQLQAKVTDPCFSQIEMLLVLWSLRRFLVPAFRAIRHECFRKAPQPVRSAWFRLSGFGPAINHGCGRAPMMIAHFACPDSKGTTCEGLAQKRELNPSESSPRSI
jgi:hypothetical protein